ncbi:hypothetical protein AOLI_G00218460 [Acnodon oligacanthus]
MSPFLGWTQPSSVPFPPLARGRKPQSCPPHPAVCTEEEKAHSNVLTVRQHGHWRECDLSEGLVGTRDQTPFLFTLTLLTGQHCQPEKDDLLSQEAALASERETPSRGHSEHLSSDEQMGQKCGICVVFKEQEKLG